MFTMWNRNVLKSEGGWAKRALNFLFFALLLSPVALLGGGCTYNGIEHGMENQPKVKTLGSSDFFLDGRGARMLVPGTVARGHLDEDSMYTTGLVNGKYTE